MASGFCNKVTSLGLLLPSPSHFLSLSLSSTHLLITVDTIIMLIGTLVLLQQLLGHSLRHLALDKRMLQQSFGCGTFLWILGQGRLEEIVKSRAPFILVAQCGRLEAAL